LVGVFVGVPVCVGVLVWVGVIVCVGVFVGVALGAMVTTLMLKLQLIVGVGV
jgi:hypothetical protein